MKEKVRFGLAFAGDKSLAWGMNRWYHWVPGQRLVLRVWNKIHCRLTGHKDILWHIRDSLPSDEVIECYNCCTLLTECTCKKEEE